MDGQTGYLVPIKDPSAVAAKLRILLDDGQLRRQMGKAAREFAERSFSVDDVVAAHLRVYDSVS